MTGLLWGSLCYFYANSCEIAGKRCFSFVFSTTFWPRGPSRGRPRLKNLFCLKGSFCPQRQSLMVPAGVREAAHRPGQFQILHQTLNRLTLFNLPSKNWRKIWSNWTWQSPNFELPDIIQIFPLRRLGLSRRYLVRISTIDVFLNAIEALSLFNNNVCKHLMVCKKVEKKVRWRVKIEFIEFVKTQKKSPNSPKSSAIFRNNCT